MGAREVAGRKLKVAKLGKAKGGLKLMVLYPLVVR
jgi:hypothetical protein